MTQTPDVLLVDFTNVEHCQDLCTLLISYSADAMGGGKPLDSDTARRSIELLGEKAYAYSFLCYEAGQAIGFANCFECVATFAAKPAINIHDLAVLESHRGRGISTLLLRAIADFGRQQGCHKLTLEVLEGNSPARRSYKKFGFQAYQLAPELGSALFLQKIL